MENFDTETENSGFTSYYTIVTNFLVSYGWYLVGLGIFYAVYRDKINKYLDIWYEKREEKKYAEKYHKNPELARERLEGVATARKKMQDELDRKSQEAEEKRKEREEQKRLEKLQQLEDGGHKLGSASSSGKKSLKSEYNPLMGDSGPRYRPPKKSCCKKGGGCG